MSPNVASSEQAGLAAYWYLVSMVSALISAVWRHAISVSRPVQCSFPLALRHALIFQ
jgi:hypothetical protein